MLCDNPEGWGGEGHGIGIGIQEEGGKCIPVGDSC